MDSTFLNSAGYTNGATKVLYFPIYPGNTNSTITYNCHGYAWILADNPSQPKRVIAGGICEESNYYPYINDGSYIEVKGSPWPRSAVVCGGGHSARTEFQPGWVISKWREGPLVRHHIDDGVGDYKMSTYTLQYYIKPPDIVYGDGINPLNLSAGTTFKISNGSVVDWGVDNVAFSLTNKTDSSVMVTPNVYNGQQATLTAKVGVDNSNWVPISISIQTSVTTISGPGLLCINASSTYTASGVPAGFTWDKSSNLTINSSSGNAASIKATGNGPGWVSVKNSGGVELKRINMWVGPPDVYYVNGPDQVGSEGDYSVVYSALSNANYFDWQMTAGAGWSYFFFNNGSSSVHIDFPSMDTYYLKVTLCNSCGCVTSPVKEIYATGHRSYSYYPNPVSDVLRVEITQQNIAQAKALQQAMTGVRSLSDPVFDLRLYNLFGNLLRQSTTKGGTVEFNVSNLPNGTYYLHINDGVGNKPEIRQIIVQH